MVVVRRFDTEAAALQRQGQLGLWPPCLGQEAAQIGSARALRPAGPRLPAATASTASRTCRGVDPADLMRLSAAASTTAAGTRPTHGIPPVHAGDRLADAARHRLRDGPAARRRGRHRRPDARLGRRRVLRRRRHQPGRRQRGDRVRRELPDAPVVFFCQNNQWAISEPVGRQSRAPLADRARRLRHPERPGRRQRRARQRTRSPRGASTRARARRRPDVHRGLHVPDGRAHHVRRPDPLPSTAEEEDWAANGPDRRGSRRYLRGRAARCRRVPRRPRRRRPTRSASRCATGCYALADPRAASVFEHVYAEPHARSNGSAASTPPTLAMFGARGGTDDHASRWPRRINAGLRTRSSDDPKVLLMGEDIGTLGGVFRVTDGLQQDFGADRVIDTPLAESGHRRHRDRPRDARLPAGVRDPVRRVRLPGVRPDHTQLAKHALPADGARHACPITIRIPYGGGIGAVEHHSRVARGVLRAHARPAGGQPVRARRTPTR